MTAETEDDLLDHLLLAAIENENFDKELTDPKQNPSTKTELKDITKQNEDEYFLSRIAAQDLKVLETPSTSAVKDIVENNEPVNNKTHTKLLKTKNLSTVHNGETDSSDDEDNRDFQNRKYNEFGKEIKHMLTQEKSTSQNFNSSKTWKTKRPVPNEKRPVNLKPTNENKSDIFTDPFFGIRISKPLISSAMLQERMKGRTAITMAKIKNFINSKQTEDWVIAGAIVDKSPVKTSQNDNKYIIFTLSDLKNDLRTVSLFLFKGAYKELWKTTIGTVIGVLNPSVMDNRDGSKQEATISVDNHQKVMIFGQSKDFAYCKSLRKDGKQCRSFVNLNSCEYCVYHVRQAYQNSARRSELQAKYAGGGLTALRNKVLGKNEVFYAGKSYMAIPAKQSKKLVEKDEKTLLALRKTGTITRPSKKTAPEKRKGSASSLEISRAQRLKDLELLKKLNGSTDITSQLENKTEFDAKSISASITLDESKKTALDIISKLKNKTTINSGNEKSLQKENESLPQDNINDSLSEISENYDKNLNDSKRKKLNSKTNVELENINPKTTKDRLATNKKKLLSDKTALNFVPKLSNPDHAIDESTDLQTNAKEQDNTERESKSANESFHKSNKKKNSVRKDKIKSPCTDTEISVSSNKLKLLKNAKESPVPSLSNTENFEINFAKSIPRRSMDTAKQNALNWIQKNGRINKTTPSGAEKSGVKRFLNSLEDSQPKKLKLDDKVVSDRFKKIMALTSKHADLLENYDLEQQEKYFNKLEAKEKMEEKMMSTFKIDCKAVKCLTCKYTNFSAAERCKEERHVLKVFNAVKRFFKCGDCGNRTCSLEIVPLFSCKQCNSSKWERTTMMKEKKVHVGEMLSIRGGEQTFLNSVASDTNINLLVPDD